MWRTNPKIGFDDRLVMLIVIPLSALGIPYIFLERRFDKIPFLTLRIFLLSLLITTVTWIGNRMILIWARTRYADFATTKKRILVQSMVMLVYTLLVNNILAYYLDVCGLRTLPPGKVLLGPDIYTLELNSNVAALLCTLTVVAVYEGIYFLSELKKSVLEKEMLKRESLKAQLNALKTQVNPHFLFNNLNTLSALIPDDPQQAVQFVQELSKVYRHILAVKDDPSISLADELDTMKAYAFLLQTRFGDNLEIHIQIPPEKLTRKIVPLSLQILMENAIKHNIVSAEKPLRIHVSAQNGRLIVSNNVQKKNQLTESTGIGLENIRNRYRLLGEKQIEVAENAFDFTVSIPLIEKE